MKTPENFNEQVIGAATLKEWNAPEIKILGSENTENFGGPTVDGVTHSSHTS